MQNRKSLLKTQWFMEKRVAVSDAEISSVLGSDLKEFSYTMLTNKWKVKSSVSLRMG